MGVSAERIAKLGIVDEVDQGAARRRASRSAGDGGHGQGLRCCGTWASCRHCRSEQVVEKRQERLRNLRGVQRGIVFSPSALLACVESLVPRTSAELCVAFSGGLDSTVLFTVWLVLLVDRSNYRMRAGARRSSAATGFGELERALCAESRSRCRSNSFRWSSASPRILS
jgi:hypothetical protein